MQWAWSLPIRHSVMVLPNHPPNSSLKDCMKAVNTLTAVRPRKTGTAREDVKAQDQHLQSVGPHGVPDGTTAHMHAPLMPA